MGCGSSTTKYESVLKLDYACTIILAELYLILMAQSWQRVGSVDLKRVATMRRWNLRAYA